MQPKYAFSGSCAPSAGCSLPMYNLSFTLGIYPVNETGKKSGRVFCRVVGRTSTPQEAYDTAQAIVDYLSNAIPPVRELRKRIQAGEQQSKWWR